MPDAKDAKVNLGPDGSFTFTACAGAENHPYEVKLDLFDQVNVEVRPELILLGFLLNLHNEFDVLFCGLFFPVADTLYLLFSAGKQNKCRREEYFLCIGESRGEMVEETTEGR